MKKFDNLFQIGEVAALFNISRKMLLNYENHNLIKPTVIDRQSGYRYFDSYTIARIQLILDLRRTGMTISEIGKYLKGTLSSKKQIDVLKQQVISIQKAIEQLEVRSKEDNEQLKIKEINLPRRHCICKEVIAKDVDDAISSVVSAYFECIKRGLKFADGGYHFCEFHKDLFDENFYELTDISMKVCICVDEKSAPDNAVIFPESTALSVSFCGEYGKSIIAYELIKKYIIENGYSVKGFPQEIYLEGNFDNDSDKNIVWIIIPIE
ncbi:MAG TPA: MerR family transcriptional regulator [Clostridia bacterium]|nr:MerR family transcriptional regulator [Clostridia bacterium]